MEQPRIVFDRDITHFLDHRIGDARCRSFNETAWKSVKLHRKYWWSFKARGWLYSQFVCPLGRHHFTQTHIRETADAPWRTFFSCTHCFKDAPSMGTEGPA
jgi:hypothetical protein